jgi:predicted MFS family arabinose efflux permease
MAIMPGLLTGDQLQAGNAINGSAIEVGSLAGPAVGGIIVAIGGSAPAFAVDAATFAVSALTLALLRLRQLPSAAAPPSAETGAAEVGAPEMGAVEAGEATPSLWTLLRQERLLQLIVVVCVVANFAFGGAFEVALPALAHARFGPTGYGAIISCLGAGAVLGTLAAARGARLRRPTVVASFGFFLCGLAVALIPYLGGLVGAAVATFVFGGANGFGNTVVFTLVQRWAPAQLLGRVMSVIMLAAMGSFPLSVFLTGLLIRRFGTAPFFPVAGAVLAITILCALAQRDYRDLGRAPRPPASSPTVLTA